MNRDKVKLKHFISVYRDLPEYPTPEDLSFAISKWYYENGGRSHIDNHTSIEDLSNPVFTIREATNLTELKEEKIQPILDSMVDKNIITVVKKTQHNTYYRFETNDYI